MSILAEAAEPLTGEHMTKLFNRFDEDTVDRLNHKYSTLQFIILAIVVSTNQVMFCSI